MAAAEDFSGQSNPFNPDIILSTVLESAGEGMLLVDEDLNICYFNRAAEMIFGLEHRKIPLHEWREKFYLYPVEQLEKMAVQEMPVAKLIQGEDFTDISTRLEIAGTSQVFYLSWNGKSLMRNGKIIGGVLSFRDIHERVKLEISMKQQRTFFKSILDLIPALIYVRDIKGDFVFTNMTFDLYLKEISRLKTKHSVYEQLFTKMAEHDTETLQNKTEKEYQDVYFLDNQERKSFKTIRFPIMDQKQNVQLLAGISFDESIKDEELKLLQEERLKMTNTSKLAAIGTLAGEIGHEINSPLTVIKSITFLLKEMIKNGEASPDFLVSKLESLESTVNRISNITRSLKNISRKESNEVKFNCSFADLFQDIIGLIDFKIRKNGTKLIYDPNNEVLNKKINCYRIQLSQVLVNLLANATDAVEGRKDPWIKMSANEDREFYYIQIEDSGAGVPDNLKDKIFDPYFTTKEFEKGTGLGLSISRNIVSAHGGDLYLAPEISPSCFVIKLPK